jgi:hypothetical protein
VAIPLYSDVGPEADVDGPGHLVVENCVSCARKRSQGTAHRSQETFHQACKPRNENPAGAGNAGFSVAQESSFFGMKSRVWLASGVDFLVGDVWRIWWIRDGAFCG